jgi:hypothetical protein
VSHDLPTAGLMILTREQITVQYNNIKRFIFISFLGEELQHTF